MLGNEWLRLPLRRGLGSGASETTITPAFILPHEGEESFLEIGMLRGSLRRVSLGIIKAIGVQAFIRTTS